MAIPSTVPYVLPSGTARTLVPMSGSKDGITRRVDPASVVGYPITLAASTTIQPTTSTRKFKVNKVTLTAQVPRNDTVYGDFVDQAILVVNLPQIVVAGNSEAVRAHHLFLILGQYLNLAAYVGADVTGGKYGVGAISDMLTGQA